MYTPLQDDLDVMRERNKYRNIPQELSALFDSLLDTGLSIPEATEHIIDHIVESCEQLIQETIENSLAKGSTALREYTKFLEKNGDEVSSEIHDKATITLAKFGSVLTAFSGSIHSQNVLTGKVEKLLDQVSEKNRSKACRDIQEFITTLPPIKMPAAFIKRNGPIDVVVDRCSSILKKLESMTGISR